MQAPRGHFLCPKFEIEPLDMAGGGGGGGGSMPMVPAAPPHVMRPLQEICCSMDASGLQQLERLEKDLEQAKQKLLVLRAQGHQESLQSENKVKFSQRVSESRYWTNEERQRFKKALKTFGTDFAAIAKFVGTRSSTQVRTHAQKYYAKLIRDYKRSGKAQAAAASGVKDKAAAAAAANARIASESSYIKCSQ